ncbi:hypothetical protein Ctob_006436 [Chrysochromulina tobinii]|uniref:Methyltransferase FkbM domain-containing protein n=1 Tax=Chrysochromulina tobinii TaxID=1460289 RepID=A0A0M0JJS4_9EUKA|nr:hypothetical protein Ctob_006436 [Chrysochromulina tobinii]|eukprot:KOO26824.1 hypothetical protein Ctob_006436 [Chrysochromulina sp. CCMP291]
MASACVRTPLPPTTYARELPPLALRRPDCRPRNIYIDMGANWCNSLQLFRRVPHASSSSPHEGSGWQVYAFEMAPLIMPYVEACCEALSRGQPLPPAPVPPSGSSSHLLRYAEIVGCHHASRGLQLQCMERALNASLVALRINRRLLGNEELIRARLGSARRSGCEPGSPFTYTLVPSAVGVREGASVPVGTGTRGLSQLLRGGMSLVSSGQPSTALPPQAHDAPTMAPQAHEAPLATVPMIDVLYWLRTAFGVADHVVLKMDIEGAEAELVPALLATNTTRLIDVLLWECHLASAHGTARVQGRCRCHVMEEQLLAAGVSRIYRDPYPFASRSDEPPFNFEALRAASDTAAPNPIQP